MRAPRIGARIGTRELMGSDSKTVIVTGASGFIGRHCVAAAKHAGYEVHAVSCHRRPAHAHPGIFWHTADLLDMDAVKALTAQLRASHLLHIAWIATPRIFWTSEENIRWLASSIELFTGFFANGGRRVVGVGTCAEYAWTTQDLKEDVSALRPDTVYGRCKLALSLALESLATVSGRSAAWARLFFPYGPGEHPDRLIPSVIRGMLAGENVKCTHGRQVRDFIFVEDVADALVAILSSDATGALNVATGHGLSLREVVSLICAKIGGAGLIEFDVLPAPAGDPERVVADLSRLVRDVGWQPAYSIETGIDRAIAAWRADVGQERNA